MKPPNLLVFRNQQVKLGDLGVSVKLDSKERDYNAVSFTPKGSTPGFIPSKFKDRVEGNELLSKNEMFSCDQFALKKTFEFVIKGIESLEQGNPKWTD